MGGESQLLKTHFSVIGNMYFSNDNETKKCKEGKCVRELPAAASACAALSCRRCLAAIYEHVHDKRTYSCLWGLRGNHQDHCVLIIVGHRLRNTDIKEYM